MTKIDPVFIPIPPQGITTDFFSPLFGKFIVLAFPGIFIRLGIDIFPQMNGTLLVPRIHI